MKLTIKTVSGNARLGVISGMGRHSSQILNTPMCLLYTPGGCAPYLSKDMLQKVLNLPQISHIPVNAIVEHQTSLEKFGKGMATFSSMEEFILYSSVQDPSQAVQSGYNEKMGVAVWTKGGKVKLRPEDYMQLQAAIQPDIFQALCDSDTDGLSKRKRVRKSVSRTLEYLDKCVELRDNLKSLEDSCMFGVCVGGYEEDQRVTSAKETSLRPVSGFILEGFHQMGPEMAEFPFTKISHLVTATLKNVPEDKPRMLPGPWDPLSIIQAVKAGIDMFDSTYPYVMAEKGQAITYVYKQEPKELRNNKPEDALQEQETHATNIMDLNEPRYHDDFKPILESCQCYSCLNFTRAYINHLLNTKELLGQTLLMMHNFQSYFDFFETIRESVAKNNLQSLEQLLIQHHQDNTHFAQDHRKS